MQELFTVLGRLRDLEAYPGNHLRGGLAAALTASHPMLREPGAPAENFRQGLALFASKLEDWHRLLCNLPLNTRDVRGTAKVGDRYKTFKRSGALEVLQAKIFDRLASCQTTANS